MQESVDNNKPGFLTGPADLSDPQTPINSMRIYVGPENTEHFVLIYQASAKSEGGGEVIQLNALQ